MKKVLMLLLTFGVSLSALAGFADGFDYEQCTGGVRITGWWGSNEDLDIPGTLNGKVVKEIGEDAFSYSWSIRTVTIPDTVVKIDEVAFTHCERLESVELPSALTTIGEEAFAGCSSLKSITIPSKVTTIGRSAFENCYNLSSLDLSKCTSLKSIGTNAFGWCNLSGTLEIPKTVTTIGPWAFDGGNNLTIITIPAATTSIGVGAFGAGPNVIFNVKAGNSAFKVDPRDAAVLIQNGNTLHSASGVTGVYAVPESITKIAQLAFSHSAMTGIKIHKGVTAIGEGAFYGTTQEGLSVEVASANRNFTAENGVLYNKNKTKIIAAPGVSGDYEIPATVTTLGAMAFTHQLHITGIKVPRTVTKIETILSLGWEEDGLEAITFFECANLIHAELDLSVATIPNGMFNYCPNLESVTIADGPTTIGDCAFCECEKLAKVRLPSTLTTIGEEAFYHCDLAEITIPAKVTTIKCGAFATDDDKGEDWHQTFYFQGPPPTSVDEEAFGYDGDWQWRPTKIVYYSSYYKAAWDKVLDGDAWQHMDLRMKEEPLEIDGNKVVWCEPALIESDNEGNKVVTIPASVGGKAVTTIGSDAFAAVDDTITVEIPSSITTIEPGALANVSQVSIAAGSKFMPRMELFIVRTRKR